MMAHLQRDSLVDQLKPGSRDVIGSDDRKRVSDATQLPFRWVCQVLGEDTDTRRLSVGSGFLIGQRVILTAAHNLWAKANRVDQFLVLCGLPHLKFQIKRKVFEQKTGAWVINKF